MDQTHERITTSIDTTIPAHLFVGSSDASLKHAMLVLQNKLCVKAGCQSCASCRMVREQQHQSVMWFHPENKYTREMLDPLFDQLAFELDDQEQFFFVIEKADFLTQSCANSLLKSVEEPPRGYHFLFLAERLSAVVPTIQSRCAIHQLASQSDSYQTHPLYDFFTSRTYHDPLAFAKTVDQSGISERESIELLDALLSHWTREHSIALTTSDATPLSDTQHAITLFSRAYEKPPMPGSSKLFWRNLFLELKAYQ